MSLLPGGLEGESSPPLAVAIRAAIYALRSFGVDAVPNPGMGANRFSRTKVVVGNSAPVDSSFALLLGVLSACLRNVTAPISEPYEAGGCIRKGIFLFSRSNFKAMLV